MLGLTAAPETDMAIPSDSGRSPPGCPGPPPASAAAVQGAGGKALRLALLPTERVAAHQVQRHVHHVEQPRGAPLRPVQFGHPRTVAVVESGKAVGRLFPLALAPLVFAARCAQVR